MERPTDPARSDEALRFFDPAAVDEQTRAFTDQERAALEDVNRRVAGAPSLESMLDFVLERTAPVCPTDRISVAFVEPGERVVCNCTRASYSPLRLEPGYSEGLAGSSLQEVIRTDMTRVLSDLEAYSRRHPDSRSTRLILQEGIRSSMTCPLVVDGRNVGLFWRSSREPDAYTERHVAMHLAVAERLAQAVEKAYRIGQLTAANRAYTEMLGFISHELKAPVASIMTDINLILGGYLGPVEDRQRAKLEGDIRKGGALLQLVREYLDLSRIDAPDVTPRMRRVADLRAEALEPAVDLVAGDIELRGQRLERSLPTEPVAAECDPDLIRTAVLNYLSNAMKYGAAGGTIELRLQTPPGLIRIAVRNTGPGFPAHERGRLFRRFSRLDSPEARGVPGTGVGLYTCARIAELHDGRVWADSEPGSWAEFGIEIPDKRG